VLNAGMSKNERRCEKKVNLTPGKLEKKKKRTTSTSWSRFKRCRERVKCPKKIETEGRPASTAQQLSVRESLLPKESIRNPRKFSV